MGKCRFWGAYKKLLFFARHIPYTFCQPDFQKDEHSKGRGCSNGVEVKAIFHRPYNTKDQYNEGNVKKDVQ